MTSGSLFGAFIEPEVSIRNTRFDAGTMAHSRGLCQRFPDIREASPLNPGTAPDFVSGWRTVSPSRRIAARIATKKAVPQGNRRSFEHGVGNFQTRSSLGFHGRLVRWRLPLASCRLRCHGIGSDAASASFNTVVIQRFFSLIFNCISVTPAMTVPASVTGCFPV